MCSSVFTDNRLAVDNGAYLLAALAVGDLYTHHDARPAAVSSAERDYDPFSNRDFALKLRRNDVAVGNVESVICAADAHQCSNAVHLAQTVPSVDLPGLTAGSSMIENL